MTLQSIQDSARKDLQKAFGCDVALQLHVKLSKSKHKRDRDYSNDYASQNINVIGITVTTMPAEA
jgi:GTPase Era involved in 16S rRNA processing